MMCWYCDLRDAADCGAIKSAQREWDRTIRRYAKRHGIAKRAAIDALLHMHAMPPVVM